MQIRNPKSEARNPKLFLVATPIGNLGDITMRALDTLREVDIIASEDTRKTGIMLKHFGIQKPQLAFHEHNEARVGAQIISMLQSGKSVAVVTNAGTPGISDPGYTLVRRALDAGIPFTMIPGTAAFAMALVLSGLAVHSFTFRGFAPRKSGPRRRFLSVDKDAPHTLIFYESPYRVEAFLRDALEVYGDREAALAHELTKLHESVERGTISTLIEKVTSSTLKGEYVIVIAGAGLDAKQQVTEEEG
ncbi:MAG TPA: 16S rRNA (cytidine(1402)-2'-O)-methyltransferase [Chloroflexia bacterium]|nr:16S rRNA (cytidine(1402)-2'-O)-methyltransferase [Chloroflexia bacterium]